MTLQSACGRLQRSSGGMRLASYVRIEEVMLMRDTEDVSIP